jgi:hypothetical protein
VTRQFNIATTIVTGTVAAAAALLCVAPFAAATSAQRAGPTTISVSTDKSVYSYNDTAAVLIHLSSTGKNKDVLLYSQTFGHKRKLIAGSPVNANGNFRTTAPMWTKTVLTAVYRGDATDDPASDRVTRLVHSIVTGKQSGYYATSRIGGYRLYHRADPPSFEATLTPALPGDCIRFQRQRNTAAGFRDLDRSQCIALGNPVSFYNALKDTHRGLGYRVRMTFEGNAANLGAASGWMYFKWWR